MSRFLVGITGGIASGKSTVARRLAQAGFSVVDADSVVADLYAPNGPGALALLNLLGPEALGASGAVNKPGVAALIFDHPERRRAVEAAIHPLVHQRFHEIASELDGVVVYEATLLVESGHRDHFDLTISVEADDSKRLQWAKARGMGEDDARARLKAQGDGEQRRQGVDRIWINNSSLESLHQKVDALIEELKAQQAS